MMNSDTINHNAYMQLALTESKKALPLCQPNPPVGCVLVKYRDIVAKGHTQAPGQFHGEAHALAQYNGCCSELVAYVTLEPCAFVGRTPSCATALIQHGIKTVHVAIYDPDPRNNGKGIALLRNAGVNVVVGTFASDVKDFLQPYLFKSEN